MDRDQLFLQTLEDLRKKTDSEAIDYEMLMSAALLRKLLINGSPLLHEVNRHRREKIRFLVSPEDAYTRMVLEDAPVFWGKYEAISPRLGQSRAGEEVDLDGFLATRVMLVRSVNVSVQDVIRHVSHLEGAVHAGHPKDDRDALLHAVNAELQVGGVGAVVRTLRGIAAVVLDGLEPLAARIRHELGTA